MAATLTFQRRSHSSRKIGKRAYFIPAIVHFVGDGAANVISDTVRLSGTLRAVTSSTVRRLRQRVEAVANATATAHGCSVVFTWEERPYPATVNDVGLANLVGRITTLPVARTSSLSKFVKPRLSEIMFLDRK
jgi:metal-dependent amidase/aminoacylase/carboxypeptidase family protein